MAAKVQQGWLIAQEQFLQVRQPQRDMGPQVKAFTQSALAQDLVNRPCFLVKLKLGPINRVGGEEEECVAGGEGRVVDRACFRDAGDAVVAAHDVATAGDRRL